VAIHTQGILKRGKGIYLLPNMLTLGALFAGYYSIIAAQRGLFSTAAIAIFFAMLLDTLDGRVARLTNTQTSFGAELDSLSDMVSFGIAPALLLYSWSLHTVGKIGWLVSFIYAACAALRLARFNTRPGNDKRYFQGLATTSSAGLIASWVWLGADDQLPFFTISSVVAILALFLGLAMVSNFPYRSFKDISFKKDVPFLGIVMVLMVLVLVAIDPPTVLFLTFLGYSFSGPVLRVWAFFAKRKKRSLRK
jgi:CDP-diacylglycerol--serine O-phosphatidyltransferase